MTRERLAEIRARYEFVAARPYMVGTDHEEIGELLARIEWLESLFDFSDPETAMQHAPNDPVTKDACVVRASEWDRKFPL